MSGFVGHLDAIKIDPELHEIRPMGEKKFLAVTRVDLDHATSQVFIHAETLTRARKKRVFTTRPQTRWVAREIDDDDATR